MKFRSIIIFVSSLILQLMPMSLVFAQTYSNPLRVTLNVNSVSDLMFSIVDFAFLLGTPLVVVFIIYGGFLFVTSRDNESQIARARFTILWTLVGASVLLAAKVIAAAIKSTVVSLGAS